ncbi:UDP-4-amino-4,6-dideoxy-N-acetyl-beta-L-altrosamine transaminase [archaeon]|jgi:UDP-4-amino-4,6-dideoxy-N-acetyl-beta-L-altrosamine transaminase|nr:UDP-4-amino-4,6-dideoxy-N-acetyl-beta-L-altrosamine transaminase [archaeon]MBT6869327.1 UDP-4-amino-4,6-dideoxy-N-acetyl-beta-L-altrosamine transaminase [archaeon]MBT7192490.1 UDP-4-amino-4,6-dideoxy-N-acetyl-beta-L-altrosamine transaminase [archaeon]MBT7380566.1 UDP-4-amino-4,6-dideoxy-N-acetyl-beta-L-altrosamine transaminase [archaeon]MBT7507804.1 UDP-4-amino-4,6-dideoxy-N-acetyl-beta-L-altrosamine transaminase [archaeon]
MVNNDNKIGQSISYGKQTISEEDVQEVVKTLQSEFLTCGPKVKEFEVKFADYVGSKYAVAVSNGTAALHLACLSVGLKKDDELITSPITFAASANCALYCGAKPVFVDVDENGLIDANKIENKITEKTKIIIPVHYTGLSCNLEKIKEIANRHNLIIIEDACHALGAKYNDYNIGDCKFSDMACFSFHPVKHITTGEGGIITTNSKEIYDKLLVLRHHGIVKDSNQFINQNEGPWYHEIQELGFNYRITDFQCALGMSQLNKIDSFVNKRREIAKKYDFAFKESQGIEIIKENENLFNSYHLYVIKVKDKFVRLSLFNYLRDNNVFCQVHYIPVYWHPYYQKIGYKRGLCPIAESFYERIISLPVYPNLGENDQDKVILLIKKICDGTIVNF